MPNVSHASNNVICLYSTNNPNPTTACPCPFFSLKKNGSPVFNALNDAVPLGFQKFTSSSGECSRRNLYQS